MKKALLSLLMFACGAIYAAAFPTLYLRGQQNNWGSDKEYRFHRNGSVYSLYVKNFSGQFKIADAVWGECIYGTPTDGNGSTTVTGVGEYPMRLNKGDNFGCNSLSDVTFMLDYVEGQDVTLKIVQGNQMAEESPLSGTLPVLYINVYTDANHTDYNNEVISKDLDHKNYFKFAEYWLDLNGCTWMAEQGAKSIGSKEEPLPLQIKARGNWTRKGFSKKPFKLKLDKKQSLLGLSKSKHFAILAHADDNLGYLRNYTGFNLGRRIGLPWTPSHQPVEVVINGDYRGLYFLTESIRIEEDRINITELEDESSDPSLASGGYLVELDNYDEDNQIRMEEKSCVGGYHDLLRITWDTPEVYSDLQKQFITDQFTAMNNAVGNNDDILWSYMDLDDAARYYLVEEIISHTESYHGSTYLFRDRGENQKWHFSPLWDFGNAFNGPTNDFFYNHGTWGNTWIASMRQNAKFNDKVRETWMWFMNNGFNGLSDDMTQYVNTLRDAAVADHARWGSAPVPAGGQPVCDNRQLDSKLSSALNHINSKVEWLKSHFGDYSVAGNVAEPARDTTPAAPLPNYLSGVEDVEADFDAAEYPVEYYDLTGRRVLSPAAGSIVIERRGPSARTIRM